MLRTLHSESMYGDIQPVPFTLTNEEFGEKGDMSMKRQYENNGKTFWEDIDSIMSMKSEQYKEAVNKNSGGEGWMCLSLRSKI